MNPSDIRKALEMVLGNRGLDLILQDGDVMLWAMGDRRFRIAIYRNEESLAPLLKADGDAVKIMVVPGRVLEENAGIFSSVDIKLWPTEDLEREIGRVAIGGAPLETSSTFLDELFSIPAPAEEGAIISATVKPTIGEKEARIIGEETVKGFNQRLELVPHFVYGYRIILQDEEGEKREKNGEVWLNAISGEIAQPLEDGELADDDGQASLEPEMDSEEGLEMVRDHIMEMSEEDEVSVKDEGGARAITKRIFLPVEDDLKIAFKGTIYMPVWVIEGTRGSLVIDAVRGELINEVFFEEKD